MLLKKGYKILMLSAFIASSLKAQPKDTLIPRGFFVPRSICLLTGFAFGKYTFADIGVANLNNSSVGPHPFSSAYFASTEIKVGDRLIIGPKIGGWLAGGSGASAIGLNIVYYTDFHNSTLVFRPEIGYGVSNLKFVYGYNAKLTKYRLDRINRSVFGMTYCFTLIRLRDKSRRNNLSR